MLILLACLSLLGPNVARADGSRDHAAWMLFRLTGVRYAGDSKILDDMAALVRDGKPREAAALATEQQQFLTVAVREMAAKMATREESVREPLNDLVASFVGVARDDSDARELLFGNFYYRGNAAAGFKAADLGANILTSNIHYEALEKMNLNWAAALERVEGQIIPTKETTFVDNPDPAGVLTSHAFMGAHAVAGTNRRLVEYAFREFMCTPLVGWADTSAPDIRIGRDIDRQPGGDPQKFQTTCKGCHTVMDGFRGAFAKYDYQQNVGSGERRGAVIHVDNGVTQGTFAPNRDARLVMRKMNRDDVIQYAGGYITTDDSFLNNAVRPTNATQFGWRDPTPETGPLAGRTTGVHRFGRLLANSQQFSRCMAKRVFDVVCKHDVDAGVADALYESLRVDFEENGYSLKKLFQAVATHAQCRN